MSHFKISLACFIAGFAVMGIEILASRFLAPVVGTSILVWTNVIGIILLSLALGAWIGGRLADCFPLSSLLGYLFCASSILLLFLSFLPITGDWLLFFLPERAAIPLLAIIFLTPPSLLLGSVQPVAIRLLLKNVERAGHIVGLLSAIGTLGSLLGTYVTGYVLIARFSTDRILYAISIILLLIGIAFFSSRKRFALAPLFLIASYDVHTLSPSLPGTLIPSHYSIVRVEERLYQNTSTRFLWMDNITHAGSRVSDLTRSIFAYDEMALQIMENLRPQATSLIAIGGGAFHLPREWIRQNQTRRAFVIERDPKIIETATRFFALTNDPRLTIIEGDGRTALARDKKMTADLIMLDAFADQYTIPWHLVTHEAWKNVSDHTSHDGMVIVNTILREDSLHPESQRIVSGIANAAEPFFSSAILIPVPPHGPHRDDLINKLLILRRKDDPLPETIKNLPQHPIERSGYDAFSDRFAPLDYLSTKLAP